MHSKKKYILKPGKHQFAPKSPAIHTNENLTDAEAEWYLNKYPHIQSLFIKCRQPFQSTEHQTTIGEITNNKIGEIKSKEIGAIKTNNNEDLSATN